MLRLTRNTRTYKVIVTLVLIVDTDYVLLYIFMLCILPVSDNVCLYEITEYRLPELPTFFLKST